MKYLDFYKNVLKCENKEFVFDYFMNNLQKSIVTWSYFVDWKKIKSNIQQTEVELNILNSLIGEKDIENKFIKLLKKYPEITKALPLLIAIRKQKLKDMPILTNLQTLKIEYKHDLFYKKINKFNNDDLLEFKKFFTETGLKDIFYDKNIKNLVDYCFGVEVGMDTNARKNRTGFGMENIVENFVRNVCIKNKFRYLKEANAKKIKEEFDYNVPVDRSSRRYDFVVDNGKELFIIETNFYGGGGSKIKATSGEYRNLFDVLDGKYKFIWVTDGYGWNKASKPLRETFEHNDYIFNLSMLENKILDYILK